MNTAAIGLEVKNVSWDTVRKRQNQNSVVVIALGAEAKEHGFHLPLNNDFIMAEHFKNRVLQELDVIVYPTINYSYFPPFIDYSGSTSIGLETTVNYIKDLILSIAHNGPRKFYILNTGISTLKPLAKVQADLKEKDIILEFSDIRKFESDFKLEQEGGTHADEGETSLMMYIAPEIVNMKLAQKDFSADEGNLSPVKKAHATFSPTGAWGDPTLATLEKGKKIEAAYFSGFKSEIKNLMSR